MPHDSRGKASVPSSFTHSHDQSCFLDCVPSPLCSHCPTSCHALPGHTCITYSVAHQPLCFSGHFLIPRKAPCPLQSPVQLACFSGCEGHGNPGVGDRPGPHMCSASRALPRVTMYSAAHRNTLPASTSAFSRKSQSLRTKHKFYLYIPGKPKVCSVNTKTQS